jgi:bifunctional ADP-heptose synthase (sugar kinase/adenylyltransferase)
MSIANKAAALAVSNKGISIIGKEIFIENQKIFYNSSELANIISSVRSNNIIGFTNGCFDCCHYGHIQSLKEAKS